MRKLSVMDHLVTGSSRLDALAAGNQCEHAATAMSLKRGLEHAMAAGELLIEARALLQLANDIASEILRRVDAGCQDIGHQPKQNSCPHGEEIPWFLCRRCRPELNLRLERLGSR